MELIVINESRLKIMLTGEDMARYDLASPAADADPLGRTTPRPDGEGIAPHTREILRHIFADAHAEIGFDTEGERLFVQLYASKGGGCEIFVTKLGGEGETKLLKAMESAEPTNRKRRVRLCLAGLNDLTALCRRLVSSGFREESAAYITEEGGEAWYLILTVNEEREGRLSPLTAILGEYGREVGGEIELYLSEYGRAVCPVGAVETLARV